MCRNLVSSAGPQVCYVAAPVPLVLIETVHYPIKALPPWGNTRTETQPLTVAKILLLDRADGYTARYAIVVDFTLLQTIDVDSRQDIT